MLAVLIYIKSTANIKVHVYTNNKTNLEYVNRELL